MSEVLLGVTVGWRSKVAEIESMGITKVALFPPWEIGERRKLYAEIAKIKDLEIPHVHLVSGMEEWEILFLRERGAVVFNIHQEYAGEGVFQKHKQSICIENRFRGFPFDLAREFGGVCIDYAHAEMARTIDPRLESLDDMPKDLVVGCAHISAVPQASDELARLLRGERDEHVLMDLGEVDYMKKYDNLPPYLSIEIDNPLSVQIRVKEHLETILGLR